MSAGPVAKVAGLFLEHCPDAAERLEKAVAKQVAQCNDILYPSVQWVQFCMQLHHDNRVQDDDPFPLEIDTVEEARNNCYLMPWKAGGKITPGSLQYLIQEAKSEHNRRRLEMIAVLQELEPIADWWVVPSSSLLLQAAKEFGLPVVRDLDGYEYVGRWEFDKKISGKKKSTVFWSAVQLMFEQELKNGKSNQP